jgi:rod shape-determining protein MreD
MGGDAMNWFSFFILAYTSMSLQTGLGAFARLGFTNSAAEPNFGLIAVVFLSLNAPRQAALLSCFIMGAIQDLATQQAFGLFAFSYGLSALAISSASRSVYRGHPLTHFFFTLFAGCVTAIVLVVQSHLRHQSVPAVTTFAAALYTAILSPFLIGALQRVKVFFAFGKMSHV